MGCPAPGFNCTFRQIVMLSMVDVHPAPAVAGGGSGHGMGAGLESLIWVGSRLDACITATTALVTVRSVGKAFPLAQLPQVARAAVMAPCWAACWMVEQGL